MVTKGKSILDSKEDFFAPQNLFKILLGEDGQGGTIGNLRKDLQEYGDKVESLDRRIEEFEDKFEEYNGLHNNHNLLATTVTDHLALCREIQKEKETTEFVAQKTAEAYLKGVTEAEKKGAQEAKETVKYTAFIITTVLGVLSATIGLITYFLGLWPG